MSDRDVALAWVEKRFEGSVHPTSWKSSLATGIGILMTEARADERNQFRHDRDEVVAAAKALAIRSHMTLQQALLAIEEAHRIVTDQTE